MSERVYAEVEGVEVPRGDAATVLVADRRREQTVMGLVLRFEDEREVEAQLGVAAVLALRDGVTAAVDHLRSAGDGPHSKQVAGFASDGTLVVVTLFAWPQEGSDMRLSLAFTDGNVAGASLTVDAAEKLGKGLHEVALPW